MKNQLVSKRFAAADREMSKHFCSGNEHLDHFIQDSYASLDSGYGQSYILLIEGSSEIIGYYNITAGAVDTFRDGVRMKSGGAVHINCFAIDHHYQRVVLSEEDGQKIYFSDFLMMDCLSRILTIRDQWVGFSFVTLNATNEGIKLYQRHGFSELDEELTYCLEESEKSEGVENCTQMYLFLDEE
jgi:hypothetical protein